ncbi:Alpha/Beta hydrolase protein [Podospora didyma]|uniref:Alpha/Beta hydrolase protein n=1 Tax=Podospora didyma TaxID=330526 RepID=A0AAE0K549_9PEZI|nr:Alpha/Beta hydrolase protein [Podospora didyma]
MLDTNPTLIQEAAGGPSRTGTTPLVLIHDGGGTIFSYHCLGELHRPLYGIANPHFRSGEPWEGGIPEMARHYVKLIKSVIPRGSKLIIGGWSLGGLLSLEISRALLDESDGAAASFDLLGIVMIDSVCPLALPKDKEGGRILVQHVVEWSPYTRQETRDAVMRSFAEARVMVGSWKMPTWRDSNLNTAHDTTSAAVSPILPRPPPVILLRAKEAVPVVEEGVSRVDVHRHDRLLGWDLYHPNLITQVIDISGHHFNLFSKEDNLIEVTEQIKHACRTVEAIAQHRGP